jgi:hypothetical protein
MNKNDLQKFKLLANNFPVFAKNCLKIKTKTEGLQPFILNSPQYRFIDFIERKYKEKGHVRVVVLKARQMGFSTVTEGYFFWKTIFNKGHNSFIMAHDRPSTSNIFEMVKRYYDNIPEAMPKPPLAKNNERALIFDSIDSYFRVGTAGSGSIGRSMTNNYLHMSEAAFFEKADELSGGIMSTVPDENSIVVLESTANGVGGFFYDKVMEGLEPDSPWDTLFYAWHEFPEYTADVPDGFVPDDTEEELKRLYNVTDGQLMWRRNRIAKDFKGREHIFRQEYPSNIQEAFLSTQNALIGGEYLERARKSDIKDQNAPVVIGVDPARSGDRTVIAIRRGREILEILIFEEMNEMELAGRLAILIREYRADACFIDPACGYGTIDRLQERHFKNVYAVPFNSKPSNTEIYSNKRTEIYGNMRDWFMQQGGVRIPDSDIVIRDLGVTPDFTINSKGQWVMTSKDNIKKENSGRSPDIADAIALTFSDLSVRIEDDRTYSIKTINNRRK